MRTENLADLDDVVFSQAGLDELAGLGEGFGGVDEDTGAFDRTFADYLYYQ